MQFNFLNFDECICEEEDTKREKYKTSNVLKRICSQKELQTNGHQISSRIFPIVWQPKIRNEVNEDLREAIETIEEQLTTSEGANQRHRCPNHS